MLSGYQVVGLLFVSAGLLLLKYRPRRGQRAETEQAAQGVGFVYVVMAFASCMLNALSGLLDKILMRDISSAQLQFWYMLFLVLFYLLYILLTRTPVDLKSAVRNRWVWMLSNRTDHLMRRIFFPEQIFARQDRHHAPCLLEQRHHRDPAPGTAGGNGADVTGRGIGVCGDGFCLLYAQCAICPPGSSPRILPA